MLNYEGYEEYMEEVVEFATKTGKLDNLNDKLKYLATYADHDNDGATKCYIGKDFAPYSFTFSMHRRNKEGEYVYWFNGGLIFHGTHDNGGDGSAPTYSVNLNPEDGWSVHT